ncbi:MAG: hypothetical protein R2710_08585 [Acidimicrobiales bacterium]
MVSTDGDDHRSAGDRIGHHVRRQAEHLIHEGLGHDLLGRSERCDPPFAMATKKSA